MSEFPALVYTVVAYCIVGLLYNTDIEVVLFSVSVVEVYIFIILELETRKIITIVLISYTVLQICNCVGISSTLCTVIQRRIQVQIPPPSEQAPRLECGPNSQYFCTNILATILGPMFDHF